ncbi:IS3 family transposase [Spiroplasma endosymbiont of Phycita roborella]|uniref:IS3 family transposase n=2 Tax=unclassified Spiroplasma TaxID=2637901 RepID=UPI00313BB80D
MTRYNKELKLKIIEQYFAGKSATTLSKENKISRKIIYIWIQKWYLQGEKGLVSIRSKIKKQEVNAVSRDFKKRPKESLKKYEKRVEKELLLLQTKIEILEKSYLYRSQNWKNHKQNQNNLKNKPFHFKPYLYECYKIVKISSEKGLKKSFLLNLLQISNEGYRKWKIRGCPEWKPKFDDSYDQAINLIFYDDDKDYGCQQEYGHKRMAAILKIGRKKALSAMKRLGLKTIHKQGTYGKKSKLKAEHKFIAPNLLKQANNTISFNVNKPLEKIALNISEFKINNQKLYLWAFVDFYSRKILHHHWSKNQEKSHLIKSLKDMSFKYNLHNTIIHTDRGIQFRTHDYWNYAKKNNIQLSMTDGYASYQNAIVETVFKTLKVVYFKRQKFKNKNTFLLHMNHAIWKYNNTRFHTIIKNTPERVFQLLFH